MKIFPAWCITFLLAIAFCSFPPPARCAPADDIIQKSGMRGGLAVILGCKDPSLAAHLSQSGPLLVCCLDPDPDVVSAARSALRKKGIYGTVTVSALAGDRLPFVDDTVNVIIVTRPGIAVSAADMRRSLAPGGAIVDLSASDAKVTRKPRPDTIDAWTHYLYDASNNAVSNDTVVAPPRGLRWKCGPRYARSHEHFGSVCAMVASSGRIFYIHDNGPVSSVFLPPTWELVARDAFSGVLLWKRPVGNWESQLRGFRSGPPEIGRRLVYGGGRLYAALRYGGPVTVIDPASGDDRATLAGSEGARELLYAGGRLYLLADDMTAEDHEKRKEWFNTKAPTLRGYGFPKEPIPMYGTQRVAAFDAHSGKQLWCNRDDRAPGEIMPATIAVSGGRVCFQTTTDVICLDADTGKQRWKTSRPVAVSRFSWATPTLVVDDGVVVTGDRMPGDNIKEKPERGSQWIMDNHHQMQKQPGEVIAFSLDDGTELWRAPAFENYTVPMDIFVIDGRVWTGHIRGKGHPGFTTGRDLKTGEVTATVPDNKTLYQLRMGHNRCYRNRATRRYLILGRDGIEFLDPEKGTGSGHWWVRGTCQYGVMPANGLVYAPVHSCACHPDEKLNGFNTIAPVSSAPERAADDAKRLAKGPATGTKADTAAAGTDWPTYRRDARRSGYQDIAAPDKIASAWTVACAAPPTAPVCAGGTVYIAETDTHTVRALDAGDGAEKWYFIADGRIDSPPTICGDCCLFGTRNGFVYCLRTADGTLCWRFRAAPRDRRLFCYGQLESVWPVHGSVLVGSAAGGANPVAYFAAGRTSHLDGGIRLWALDAASGDVLHEATVCMNNANKANDVITARALPDILSLQDGSIYMRNIRLDRKLAPQKNNVRHLYAPGGFLDDSWWHRTYWIYGTRMMSAYGGWPKIGNVTPAGRLLVFDGGDLIYGYGRMSYRAGAGHVSPDATKDYKLFAEVRSPKPKPVDKKKKKRRRGPRGHREITWSKNLPFIARAMVLSRDALLVAGGAGLPGTGAEQKPGTFRIVSREDGEQRAACSLPAPPVLDGMILTGDGIFVSVTDGTVVCLK